MSLSLSLNTLHTGRYIYIYPLRFLLGEIITISSGRDGYETRFCGRPKVQPLVPPFILCLITILFLYVRLRDGVKHDIDYNSFLGEMVTNIYNNDTRIYNEKEDTVKC